MGRLSCRIPSFAVFALVLPRATAAANYYQLLGITEFADADEIKKAYRKQSLHYHPDKFTGDPQEAQDMMVKLNDAFKCLKDPATRKMYEYYEHDYESMAEYEAELKKKRMKDIYLYDSDVHILWGRNIDKKFKPLAGLNHTWVLNLYDPNDEDCKKQASEFKTFARMAERKGNFRAGAVNCALEPGLCHKFWQMLREQKVPAFMVFPSLQPDENQATDFEEFDTEQRGWPSARELERFASKVAAHEVVQVDGAFLEENITRNPRSRGISKQGNASSPVNETQDDRIAIWAVWFYHSQQCSKVEACDETAPGFRKLSNDLRGVARFAAINCKLYSRACRGLANGPTSIRLFVQRGIRHFVESFTLDYGAYSKHKDTVALGGAAQILKLLVKPSVKIWYPPHPYHQATEGAKEEGNSAAAQAAAGGKIDVTKDLTKLKVKELRSILASRGERCVGCTDKSEFIAKVREIAQNEAPGEAAASKSEEL